MLEARAIGRQATRSENWLIRDVSLSVVSGDRLAVVGASGSGKSVLLRALSLLDPVEAGSILWKGRSIQPQEVPEFRNRVIYLRQQPALFEGTVEDNLRRPFSLKVHCHRKFEAEPIVAWLKWLGRSESFLRKQHGHLSGGETQIVSLLRAIQLDPQILLLDEPTAALDTATASQVEQIVGHWMNGSPEKRAFVWVTHDPTQARRVSTRITRISDGMLSRHEFADEGPD